MFNLFGKNPATQFDGQNFDYLPKKTYYFDSSCQTLRPEQVIQAETDYYHNFNTCGHRVKYKWGEKVDLLIENCRENLLKLVGKKSSEYAVSFNLNTTSGINQILFQLKAENFEKIVTSEIEHNSVFLPSLVWSQKNHKPRLILKRDENGNLLYQKEDLKKAVVIVNTTSNIDGRNLLNLKQLAIDVAKNNGLLLLDACQTIAHYPKLLQESQFDAVFISGHKMYGPSIGAIIFKRDLIEKLDPFLIGGSTVEKVSETSYNLISNPEEIYARLEPGLQNFAGIIGLNQAIEWKEKFQTEVDGKKLKAFEYEKYLTDYLYQKLQTIKNIHLIWDQPSPVVSLYSNKFDGHQLAIFLSEVNIMCRSGYHCCHYYLQEVKNLPPLFRISLGLHNNTKQIDFLTEKMKVILD